nr:hypothetical protein [Tanacetum cinerariifolium]
MAGGVRVGKWAALMANEVIPQYPTSPLPFGSQIPNKSDHQKVVEYENERVLAAKRKAEASKDRAVGKRDAIEGASQQTKKRKTAPLSFALSLFEVDGSNRSGSSTHHYASPLNIIIPNKAELTTRGHEVSSFSGGSHRRAFPGRNPGGDGIALQQVHLGCVEKEADLTEKLVTVEKERDDLLDKDREREEKIRQLEADLASKTSSLTEAEGAVSTLKGDLERLTVDLSHAKIRLLSSDEYKKIMSDVFNLAIVAGWSEGAKGACSEEEA